MYLKALLSGVPGAGKTRFAATASSAIQLKNILYLDCGGNPVSFRDYVKKPTVIEVRSKGDLSVVYNYLAANQELHTKQWKALLKRYPGIFEKNAVDIFDMVIFDQISEFQELLFSDVMEIDLSDLSKVAPKRTFHHYDAVLRYFQKMMIALNRLPIHTLLVTWELYNEETAKHLPHLEGKSVNFVNGKSELVIRLVHKSRIKQREIKDKSDLTKIENFVLFLKHPRADLKNLYGGQHIDYLIDPTIQDLFTALEIT